MTYDWQKLSVNYRLLGLYWTILYYHVSEIHTNERDFPCTECSKAFVSKYDLQRHLKLHDKKRQIKEGTYDNTNDEMERIKNLRQCEQCGKICSSSGDLKKHMRVHSNERPYPCNECGKTFKSSTTLHNHERIHTQVNFFLC